MMATVSLRPKQPPSISARLWRMRPLPRVWGAIA
jgi:hypothetical protein